MVFDEKGWATSKQVIAVRMRALVARALYENDAFYMVINEINPDNKEYQYLQTIKQNQVIHYKKIISKVSSESRPSSSNVLSGLMVATSISNFFAIAFDTISNEFISYP